MSVQPQRIFLSNHAQLTLSVDSAELKPRVYIDTSLYDLPGICAQALKNDTTLVLYKNSLGDTIEMVNYAAHTAWGYSFDPSLRTARVEKESLNRKAPDTTRRWHMVRLLCSVCSPSRDLS